MWSSSGITTTLPRLIRVGMDSAPAPRTRPAASDVSALAPRRTVISTMARMAAGFNATATAPGDVMASAMLAALAGTSG